MPTSSPFPPMKPKTGFPIAWSTAFLLAAAPAHAWPFAAGTAKMGFGRNFVTTELRVWMRPIWSS